MRSSFVFCALLASCGSTKVTSDAAPDVMEEEDAGIAIPCDPSGRSKGPWSLAMTQTSITVRWETCKAGTPAGIFFAPEGTKPNVRAESVEKAFDVTATFKAPLNPNAPQDHATRWYLHEAKLDGLEPSTCYRYELEIDRSISGRFCTARPPGEAFRFMAIGDTNPSLGSLTGDLLAKVLPKNPELIVHAGDIQYYESRVETWASWFPVMSPMLRTASLAYATGNHEYETKTEYQEYVERFFGGAGFDGTNHYYRLMTAGVWFFMLDSEEPFDITSPQGQWLVASLADASTKPGYRFSIVTIHKLFVTCGDTGDHPDWVASFTAPFDQYKVPLVIQAHMHGYERFEINGRTFITTAGGGGIIGNVDENKSRSYCAQRVASGPHHHAMIFDVSAGKISGSAINESGNVVDQFEKMVP